MIVTVLGATGVLGRNVIPRLVEHGHRVRAVVRSLERADAFRRMGVEIWPGDILNRSSLIAPVAGGEAVLHLATAIPRASQGQPPDWSLNDRIRREGTENLLAAARENGLRRYIQQSITLLYGDHGQQIVDERLV